MNQHPKMLKSKICFFPYVRCVVLCFALILFLIPASYSLDKFVVPEHWESGVHALPRSSRPYIFWYWIAGHISKQGITEDLEAMKRGGIGGAMIFNIGVPGMPSNIKIYSPEWKGLMVHAITEGKRVGVDIALNNSMSGWSSSGGPWITPELSMRKLTWNEIQVTSDTKSIQLSTPINILNSYKDVAVLAFPTPASELPLTNPVKVSSSDSGFDATVPLKTLSIPPGGTNWDSQDKPKILTALTIKEKEEGYIQWIFPEGIHSATLHINSKTKVKVRLLASHDGKEWKELAIVEQDRVVPVDLSYLSKIHYTHWRSVFAKSEKLQKIEFSEINLSRSYRIADWGGKAMFDHDGLVDPEFSDTSDAPQGATIVKNQILDLTKQLNFTGELDWKVPHGNWTILRIGHTSTGSRCGPSVNPDLALECDKLNEKALEIHWQHSVQPWLDQPELNSAITTIHIDSYERGAQNWTLAFPEKFQELKGYDLRPHLITMTGRVIDSIHESEKFLWDFRNVRSELFHKNYFGKMSELCESAGKKFSLEPYHQNQFNTITAGGKSHIPTCEVWMASPGTALPSSYWTKVGASPAHIYGRQLVGCEALTAPPRGGGDYSTDFWDLKNTTNAIFCGGVNFMFLHVYVHQPQSMHLPGLSLSWWGTHFERTNTWWEQMPGFTSYVSRTQALLQQGRFKADILFSTGENSPNKSLDPNQTHALPVGYDYDVCDPYTILNRLEVKENKLVLPNGACYELLVLPKHPSMTLAMAKRIHELLIQGAKIIGPKPLFQPTLNPSANEAKFNQVVDSIWQDHGLKDQSLSEALKVHNIGPDFLFTGGPTRFTHREFLEGDLYFVANTAEKATKGKAIFRLKEGNPKLFDPVTGEIRSLTKVQHKDGLIALELEFEMRQSFLIYFDRSKVSKPIQKSNFPKSDPLFTIDGAWEVFFNFIGEPSKKVVFETLSDWTAHSENSIKYFSGKATYRKTFSMTTLLKGRTYEIDIGKFKNVAELRLNGQCLGVVWCAPWKILVPEEILKKGENQLEIDIINLWPNRMIGDEQLPDDVEWTAGVWTIPKSIPQWFEKNLPRPGGRKTFSSFKHWKKDSQLLPSGLFGPVRVLLQEDAQL